MNTQAEACPFCHTPVPAGAVVCAGCHAFKSNIARAKRLSGTLAFAWVAWLIVSGLLLNGLIQDFTAKDALGFLGVLGVGGLALYLITRWALQVKWWRRM
ncbi:hypothetical protein GCM10028794_28060 [Silanimonas algicola]